RIFIDDDLHPAASVTQFRGRVRRNEHVRLGFDGRQKAIESPFRTLAAGPGDAIKAVASRCETELTVALCISVHRRGEDVFMLVTAKLQLPWTLARCRARRK